MPKARISIAEDIEAVTRKITTSLEKLGYLVLGRADRSEAILPMVQEILPDLVFIEIDIQGEINGVQVGQKIQTDFDIPVIFISAHADANTPEDAMPDQAYGFMVQPFEVHALDSTIAMALEKHQRIRRLRESEERYALAVRAANDGIWDWNLRTSEIYFSVRWKEMLGYRDDEIGAEVNEWFRRIHPDDRNQVRAALVAHLRDSTPRFECEYRIQHANATYLWVLSRGTAMRDSNGRAYRLAGSQSDVTARKLAEERLAHDAVHDALTGLPNRILFVDRVQNRLERTKRNPDDIFAVMFIDLDRFKVVNDSLGHAFGDQLLVTTGWRLQQCLRPQDTVARLSGDEFAVLLDVVNDSKDIPGVAERIRSQLITTTLLGVVERSPTASIGLVMFNNNYTAAEDLLRDADLAMYHAKRLGGNQYQFFDDTMHTSAVEQLQLEGELKHAVARKEWLVYYQPIISITSGEPVGAEALVRWRHPQRGILAPAEFIQVAEDTGLIVPIGEYVLRTACQQAKAWRDASDSTFWVSVNISARQFRNKDLVEMIARILKETGLSSDGLRLEITESVAVQNTEYTIKIMNELVAMGVYTSLDDFGTGYSSLSYLKQFPLRVLKVDQSFIQDIQHSPKNEALIEAIIGMARSLGLEVVGEGVETAEQLQFLRTQMCDQVQGFLFSRPIPAEDLGKLLE
jgi:diguanylate cyclase (GGDEF)-like protein/PAS domain S-box-containing protein